MSEPNVHGFQAHGQNCEVRVYKSADGILSYEAYRDGAIVVERHRAPDNQSEQHLVEEQMQIMGATLPMIRIQLKRRTDGWFDYRKEGGGRCWKQRCLRLLKRSKPNCNAIRSRRTLAKRL
jgi:hypothetical protein